MKSSRSCEDPLEEPGGVGLGPAHATRKEGAKVIECVAVEAIEPGGASLDANAAPAPTEGTASVKLIGVAEKAAAAEPEALEPRAEGEARRGLDMPLPPSQEDSGEPRSPLREAPTKGMRNRGLEAPLSPPRESPYEGADTSEGLPTHAHARRESHRERLTHIHELMLVLVLTLTTSSLGTAWGSP